jgi:hypothetical protein
MKTQERLMWHGMLLFLLGLITGLLLSEAGPKSSKAEIVLTTLRDQFSSVTSAALQR